MTSVAGSAVLLILAIVLFFFLCMKGFGMIPTAIVCTIILGFAVEGGPVAAIWGPFAQGMGGFAGGLVFPFVTGGIFGGVMTATGCSEQFGRTLIKKFGVGFAPYALMVFVMVLSYVNIISFPFLGAILAFSLMRAADLPRNVACVSMVGTASITMYYLPGSVTTANMTAAEIYGVGLYSGPIYGVIAAIVAFGSVALYVNHLCKRYRAQGIGYTGTEMEKALGSDFDENDAPSFFVSLLPIVVVVGACMVLQLGFQMDPYAACVIAQLIGIVLCVAMNWKRIAKKLMQVIREGAETSCIPLLQTCMVVGFATVVTQTAVYNALMNAVLSWSMNPYLLCVLGTMLFACISADPISGITLSGSMLGARCIELGASAPLLCRLTQIASTTFDSMPWSGNLNVTMNFLGLTHKEAYGQIVVVQIGCTTLATVVAMILMMIFG